jgi:hypothetical protein
MDYDQIQADLGFTAANKAAWLEANGKYYDDPEQGWKDKLLMHAYPKRSASVYVMPSYQSPITGQWIDTPSQRREDMKRSGSRPWEGRDQELKEAQKRKENLEKETDKLAEKMAVTAWQQLPEQHREALSG